MRQGPSPMCGQQDVHSAGESGSGRWTRGQAVQRLVVLRCGAAWGGEGRGGGNEGGCWEQGRSFLDGRGGATGMRLERLHGRAAWEA